MLSKITSILLFVSSVLYSAEPFSIHDMTLEEKVGQILMIHIHGEEATDNAKAAILELKVGGIIYYKWANGLTSIKQVSSLSQGLQSLSKQNRLQIPLLIATDQEGGRVTRIDGLISPSNGAFGEKGNSELVQRSATYIGGQLKAAGINMNLAPVVDINSNPLNPIIGDRSFGNSPELVCRLGQAAVNGYHEAGIITCLKHFPGHGDVEKDSHFTLPVINKSRSELDRVELLPFATLAPYTDCIMTAHLLVPALDPNSCATLSKMTLDVLKDELHFTGVIISDSLVMEGLLSTVSTVDETAIQAFIAGCDILLLGGKLINGHGNDRELSLTDIKRIRNNLMQAVKEGRISMDRLNESVQKILDLKLRYNIGESSG